MEKKEPAVKKKKTGKKIAIAIIVVLLLVILGVALRYLLAYNGFLDKITERKPETKQYSVVVKADSEYNDIANLNGKSIGFLKIDSKVANAEQKLREVIEFETSYYDDLGTLATVLKSGITDAVTLESDWVEMLKEEDEELGDVKIIYDFSIELDSEDVKIVEKEVTGEPFIVYISGSDSRNGLKATARSDVNIIAVVNPAMKKILLVSIPRDTYVQLHNTVGLKDKLTHAGVYGINMSKTTIEDFLGIETDYTIKVSFDTVVKVVDQLDGIEIDSDQEMKLKTGNKVCEFTVGKQLVYGDCALRFARERKSYATGDRHRGENQQQVITSIIDKLAGSKNYLLKLPTILDIAGDSFETTFTRDNVAKFIRMQLMDGTKWQVESISIDGTGTYAPTYSMGANRPLYVMTPSEASVTEAKDKIKEYLQS